MWILYQNAAYDGDLRFFEFDEGAEIPAEITYGSTPFRAVLRVPKGWKE